MGNVLHLHDAHEQVQLLLPWRANGTLEAQDAALVEAHLAECEECRADLADELALRANYAAMPAAVAPRSRGRVEAALPRSGVALLRRRVPLGWALGAQAAVAAAALAMVASWPVPPQRDDYQLLASKAQPAKGNAIVLFAPETTERDLRAALDSAGARIVNGPTASGAFVLQLDQASRIAGLGKLRGNRQVLLAEPIDPASGP
jgi:anti-sigma factor RsiW